MSSPFETSKTYTIQEIADVVWKINQKCIVIAKAGIMDGPDSGFTVHDDAQKAFDALKEMIQDKNVRIEDAGVNEDEHQISFCANYGRSGSQNVYVAGATKDMLRFFRAQSK